MLTSRTTSRVVLLCWVILFLVPVLLFSKGEFQKQWAQPISMNGEAESSLLNIGNWGYWAFYDGMTAHDPYTGGGGGYFPKGKVPLIYMDGFLWGAILRDPATGVALSDTPRVGGVAYRTGLQPGWISMEFKPIDPWDKRVRIYRIRSDWRNLTEDDLRMECAYLFNVDKASVTQEMMQSVREQYSEDWKSWPVDLGAPYVDVNNNGVYDPVLDSLGFPDARRGDYPGISGADQVIWMVVNDMNPKLTYALSGSPPIGLEVGITLWTYRGAMNLLSNVVFKRIELINCSGYVLDSMYVSAFVDPDIGDYSDDLVGCDSVNSTAFAYNGSDADRDFLKFDLPPAALEYDFLQGPMVQSANPQDTAVFNFKYVPGYKNMKMTSFYFQCSGGYNEEITRDIDYTLMTYNIMRGFVRTKDFKNPMPQTFKSGPKAGQITKFPLSGNPITDPNAQYGDIDGQGNNCGPGDRRMYLNSGPFTMQPGEKQDIILAIIGGLGKSRLKSLQETWEIDRFVKRLYKHLMADVPKPPDAPLVRATPLDDKIVLNWGFDQQRIREIEETTHGGYAFEGYTVYQLPSPNANLKDGNVKRLATFDRIDGVTKIYGQFYSPYYHAPIYGPLQYGTDSGVQRFFVVNWDSIKNRPLYRGSTYYFAVTAYTYNQNYSKIPSLESSYQVLTVTLQGAKPGDRYLAQTGEKLAVKANKNTDVGCRVVVLDPSVVTGHTYEVFFTEDRDSLSPNYGKMVWNLMDSTTGQVVLTNRKVIMTNNPIPINRFPASYVDGLNIWVFFKNKPKIKAIVEVANGNGPLGESDWDMAGAPFHGNNVWHSLSAPSDPNRFYISSGRYGTIERLERYIEIGLGHDFELRFTPMGSLLDWYYNDPAVYATVPFEMWDVGPGTFDDPNDDRQMITLAYSPDSIVGQFKYHTTDPAFGFPATDWIYARQPVDSSGSYQAFYNDITGDSPQFNWLRHSREVLSEIIICDFGGARTFPQPGTVVRFITNKGPDSTLKFRFTAPGRIENDQALLRQDVEKINVFPNPYYGASEMEPDRFTHFVTFNHLPPHAIFRVFTLNGALVRKMEKNDPGSFFRWDLRNSKGLPVASGLYLIQVTMPELKKSKLLKLMIIEKESVGN